MSNLGQTLLIPAKAIDVPANAIKNTSAQYVKNVSAQYVRNS